MIIQDSIQNIVVHDNCSDGLLSGLLLKEVYPEATLRFVQYQTYEHQTLVAEPGMMFADFSPPENRVQEFVDAGAYILDHHRKAKSMVDLFGSRGAFGDENKDPGVCVAVLVLREVVANHPTILTQHAEKLLDIVTLAGIRDTWQSHSPRWREALIQNQVLSFYPKTWWLARPLGDILASWDNFLEIGTVLLTKNDQGVQKTVDGSRRFVSKKGTRGVVFEGVRKASDAAELLGDTTDLVVGFGYFEENTPSGRVTKMVVSTRSHTTFDCMSFCAKFGGGGHTKAAGLSFVIDVEVDLNPFKMVENIVNAYEEM